jgi:hypothetical protein
MQRQEEHLIADQQIPIRMAMAGAGKIVLLVSFMVQKRIAKAQGIFLTV